MNSKSVLRILTWTFIIFSAFGLVAWFYVYYIYYPQLLDTPGAATSAYTLEIKQGESVKIVADELERAQIVSTSWALVEYLKREDLATKVEAGSFKFAHGEKIPDVARRLLSGGTTQIKLTILEGWNSSEIDATLVKLEFITSGEFADFVRSPPPHFRVPDFATTRGIASLEGYIFPDTYFLDKNKFSVAELVNRMLAEMEKNLTLVNYDVSTSKRTLHEILTLASIVELEEKNPKNRPFVADILWRRLDAGIALGADATLFYVTGHKTDLTVADLALDSPYNTRKFRGLPPTPVASPSIGAIRAVLNPEANSDWYYLHDLKTGEIHFGKTLEEHNQNKARYLQNKE